MFRLVKRKTVYECRWATVFEDDLETAEGVVFQHMVLERPNGVGVVALTGDGKVVLTHQWRHPIKKWNLEVPKGGLSENETPLAAAKRELLEEVGFTAVEMISLGSYEASSGLTNEVVHLFLARGLTQTESAREHTELLEEQLMDFGELLDKVQSGEVTDAVTIIGVLKSAVYLGVLRRA